MSIDCNCKHPLKGFIYGINPKTNNNLLKVCSYKTNHVEKGDDGKLRAYEDDQIHNVFGHNYYDFVEIPCGQCISCRLNYAREWANRCALEMTYHKSTLFLTLTYDDEHLPTKEVKYVAIPGTEEIKDITVHSLVKSDLQKFMKSLRDKLGYGKYRFYASGEYGDESARPHYHLIIFGLELDDLVKYKTVYQGGQYYTYYNSKTIDDIWKKGFCVIAPATWETISYTARYVMKKLKGKDAEFYRRLNIEPEFCLMSRKPGIGSQYFNDNYKHIFETGQIVISNLKGSKTVTPPRYFKKALESLEPDWYNNIKEHNQAQAEIVKAVKMQKTSLSYLDYLQVEELELKEKAKYLQRTKV